MGTPRIVAWENRFKALGKFTLLDSHKKQLRSLLPQKKQEKDPVDSVITHLEELSKKMQDSEPASSIVFLPETAHFANLSQLRHENKQGPTAVYENAENKLHSAQNTNPLGGMTVPEDLETKEVEKSENPPFKKPLLVDGYTQTGIAKFHASKDEKERCAITMFAKEDRIGGNGWPHRGTQEESMLLFSDLRLYMPQGVYQKLRYYYYLPGEKWGPGDRGFDKIGGGYCVQDATLFGNGKEI